MSRGNSFLETGGLAGGGGSSGERGFIIVSPSGIAVGELAIEVINSGTVNLNASQRAWSTAADLLSAVYISASQVALLEYAIVRNGVGPTFSSDPNANPIVWGCGEGPTVVVDVWVRISGGNQQLATSAVIIQDNDSVCPP